MSENVGTITVELSFDEYRAVGAALVTSGDRLTLSCLAALEAGEVEKARLSGHVLELITGVIERITVARDAAGWGAREAPDVPENVGRAIN